MGVIRTIVDRAETRDPCLARPDSCHDVGVLVRLRNPNKEVEMRGPISVIKVLRNLDLNRESVLVIRNGTLVPGDAMLDDDDIVEVRAVISGGAQ